MISALKNLGFQGYIDVTIDKPALLLAKKETTMETKQETQKKIDL